MPRLEHAGGPPGGELEGMAAGGLHDTLGDDSNRSTRPPSYPDRARPAAAARRRGGAGAAAAENRRGNRYPPGMADEDAAPVPTGAAHLRLLERARRLAVEPAAGHPLADLAARASDAVVAAARGLPLATVRGLRSFYDQLGDGRRACDGTACRFGGGEALARRLARGGAGGAVRCLRHCYAPPSFRDGDRVFARPAGQPLEAWLAELDEGGAPGEAAAPIPRRAL